MKKKNEIYNTELFWVSSPNSYISMYMKYDWFQMDRMEFIYKYINEYLESKLEEKKEAIKSVISPIWDGVPTSEKYAIISLFSDGENYVDMVHKMLSIKYHIFDCPFLNKAIDMAYYKFTGLNYDTNYFASFGILKSLKK